MNKASKAALFNTLLFPGWGQLYLKQYKKGIAIILATIAGVLSLILSVIQTTIDILRVAPLRKGAITFSAVVQTAIKAIKALDMSYLFLIFLSLILVWILSIIDAYLTGKREMAKAVAPEESI
jgi:TM2 domain-containing membrane protein YozV